MRASAGSGPRQRLLRAALGLLFTCGCQAVFGDFEITPKPEEAPGGLGTACEPDQYRCTNELLETCNDTRTGWVTAETCASPAECNSGARTCRPCRDGEHQCRGNVLERCEGAAWVQEQTCATPEACSLAPDRTSGACAQSICDAGEYRCDGAGLSRCSPALDAFELVALCAGPELCDAAYANELAASGARGACREPACAPNAYSCDGATLRHCAPDRTGWDQAAVCDSPDLCNVARAACTACNPGDTECNGAELRRCSDAGRWEPVETCASATLCDGATGSCRAAECDEPGALRCGQGVPVLETCSGELAWEVVEACATVELCSEEAERCLVPACALDEVRCEGARHQRCSHDRTHWETIATCAASEICDATAGCTPGPCPEGGLRCSGASLERCVAGHFEEVERCATAALCHADSGMCQAPACPTGEDYTCRTSSIISKCTAERDGYQDFRTCTNGRTCDATPALGTGLPECDLCVPNTYACNGMDLVRCSSDGQLQPTVQNCKTSCAVTAGVPACD